MNSCTGSTAFAAFAMSLHGFGTLGGRFFWGYVIFRLSIRRALLTYVAVYGLSIIIFILPSSMFGVAAATAWLGISVGGWMILQSQTLPDYFGRQIVGSLTGYAGIFVTAARSIAPLFAALMYDSTRSYTLAFSLFAVACFVAGAAIFLAPSPQMRSRQKL